MVISVSFCFAAEPKACVRNNAGVVLKVGQVGISDTPLALGQSMKVYAGARLILFCANRIGEYHRCTGDGYREYNLQDGQTLEVMGNLFDIGVHITDNTCK